MTSADRRTHGKILGDPAVDSFLLPLARHCSSHWPRLCDHSGNEAQRQEEGSRTNTCDQIPAPYTSFLGSQRSSKSTSILTVQGVIIIQGIRQNFFIDAKNDDDDKKQQRLRSADNVKGVRSALPSISVVLGVKDEKNLMKHGFLHLRNPQPGRRERQVNK